MHAPHSPMSTPGVFRADGDIYARTASGTFLRVSPTAPETQDVFAPAAQTAAARASTNWAVHAFVAAERHESQRSEARAPEASGHEAQRGDVRTHVSALAGPSADTDPTRFAEGAVVLEDFTGLGPCSPAATLQEILSRQGHEPHLHAQNAPDAALDVRTLLVRLRSSPPTGLARTAPEEAAPAETRSAAVDPALPKPNVFDIHAEGAQWYLHPLRLAPEDPTPEQVLRRRLAATPAHQALNAWWRLAGVGTAAPPEEVLHRVNLAPSPLDATVVAWHAAQVITNWLADPDSSLTARWRRRLSIVDTVTLQVTEHPVLPHPIPHGQAPEEFGG
ncbi:hypothetical protein [Nesterenkonia cremea]|uniref:Uncharacterized protein n=1 Tax=Nesterenkonia cremea TaxID=1882340 RepID=A0A917ETF0_9MICC|nr:hypothetical protein [Nesterenkonia cremea]GGE78607.1 hypothetical protein GCM10011401_27360 [Nesterenkonia cremea]